MERSIFLGYEFLTDMFMLDIAYDTNRLVGNGSVEERSILRAAVTTLHEALRKSVSLVLDIDFNEINGGWRLRIKSDGASHIYHFWYSVLYDTENLLRLITDTPVTIEERERQKMIYNDAASNRLNDGFATLFLNRVNFSGVIKGGPIGGLSQAGEYKIDCRFNKEEIKNKIVAIAKYRSKIKLYNKDAGYLIRMCLMKMKSPMFLNIDPPYVVKGNRLYTNYFTEGDHLNFQRVIFKHLTEKFPWIITYDDCDLIRDLYKQFYIQQYDITHNAGSSTRGKEIVITNLPANRFLW